MAGQWKLEASNCKTFSYQPIMKKRTDKGDNGLTAGFLCLYAFVLPLYHFPGFINPKGKKHGYSYRGYYDQNYTKIFV